MKKILCNHVTVQFFLVHIAIGLRSRFTKITSNLEDYDEFCTNEGIIIVLVTPRGGGGCKAANEGIRRKNFGK